MRKTFAVILFLFISFIGANAQQIIEGFEAPESIIKTGNKLFVSNIGGAQPNPAAKDSNGFISELSLDGKFIQRKFQKTILNGPKGLAVIDNVIYVADIDRIVGFDINSGAQVFEQNIPEAKFLNDLCAAGDNMLAVSESMLNKIYLVNIAEKTYKFAGSVAGANGVTYDAKTKRLYACGMGMQMNGTGKLYEKDINNKDTVFNELQNSPTGIFDGIELMDKDHLLVSDWISFDPNETKARLLIYDIKNHKTTDLPFEQGPADIYYDKALRKVYIPQLPHNRIIIEDIDKMQGTE